MPSKVVVGVQWGDEGKGKIIDILAQEAQVVVRAQGGNNAGHTVEQGSEVYKLRTVPSGILYPDTLCLVGNGVVVNPGSLLAEMDGLEARGVSCKNLKIDPRAHVIMPWHPLIDGLAEEARTRSTASAPPATASAPAIWTRPSAAASACGIWCMKRSSAKRRALLARRKTA